MQFEIEANKIGKPYLKRVDRPRRSSDPRGLWVDIGHLSHKGIERVVYLNRKNDYLVLIDEDNNYRMLVLTE